MWLATHTHSVVARMKSFLSTSTPGHFLVGTSFPVTRPGLMPLYRYRLLDRVEERVDELLAHERPLWAAKEGIDDDSLPCICPRFGIGEHSAWIGMDVRLQEDTCLPKPIIGSAGDLDRLRVFRTDTAWFEIMRRGYSHLRQRKDGTFHLSVRGTLAPMDMANAVRGDDFFLDLVDQPEFTHRLLRTMTEAIAWYFRHLRSWADTVEDGFASFYGGIWLPGNTIGHLSNDAAFLCSPEAYSTFGFPYEQGLIRRFGRGFFHVHNEKMHFVPQLSSLPGLALLEVTQDPKTTPPLEDWDRISSSTGSVPLMVRGSSQLIRRSLEQCRGRNVLFLADCQDRADAESLVADVRNASLPLG